MNACLGGAGSRRSLCLVSLPWGLPVIFSASVVDGDPHACSTPSCVYLSVPCCSASVLTPESRRTCGLPAESPTRAGSLQPRGMRLGGQMLQSAFLQGGCLCRSNQVPTVVSSSITPSFLLPCFILLLPDSCILGSSLK